MNKSYILLHMYDDLRGCRGVRIDECCGRYGISIATFRRYIAFLRAYFSERYGAEVVYDSRCAEYRIEQS